jgi:double-stranded uracil-DNA glycosylase
VSGMDHELPAGALGREACAALKARITAAEPEWLAFTSLAAGRRYLGRAAGFGEQPEGIGRTRLWVLPSPSPAAGWNWESNKDRWRMLADEARFTGPAVARN